MDKLGAKDFIHKAIEKTKDDIDGQTLKFYYHVLNRQRAKIYHDCMYCGRYICAVNGDHAKECKCCGAICHSCCMATDYCRMCIFFKCNKKN